MCGIAGMVLRQGAVDSRRLDEMTDTLAHRGPDGRGTWINGNVGLGHRLLRIVGECPQPHELGDCVLTYNGEIYGIPGSLSDTARLIPLYWQHGWPWMLRELNGMFAFALYDRQTDELYLARDRFGEKPLYYAQTDEGFFFASEIKALLPFVGVETNEAALADYRRYQFALGEDTLYRGIKRLEPGCWLVVHQGHAYARGRYWSLPEVTVEPEPKDYAELLWLIVDAVKIRTRADCQVGTYVSGGLDSSLVTALVKPARAFHGDFAEPGYSELDYALAAAKHAGAMLDSTHIWPRDLIGCLDEVMYHLDEPAAGVGALPQWLVAKSASEFCRVMLTGQGADEIFGGYARYADRAGIARPQGYENYKLPEQYEGMTLDQAQRWDIAHSLPALLHVDDRVNMAHGIESRAPFLDHRIADFVFSRPAPWRLRNGQLKGALKAVARGVVPKLILDRKDKCGFAVPLMEWFGADWKGSRRELWQEMSLAAWSRTFQAERLAA